MKDLNLCVKQTKRIYVNMNFNQKELACLSSWPFSLSVLVSQFFIFLSLMEFTQDLGEKCSLTIMLHFGDYK